MNQEAGKYVYGVIPPRAGVPRRQGIGGARLQKIVGDDVAALVSDLPADKLLAVGDDLMAHSSVLEQAFKRGVVLPMRFGMVLADEQAVREELLEPYGEELAWQLKELDGKVELRVRAVYDETALMTDIVSRWPEIARLQGQLREQPADLTYYERINLGQLVAAAVDDARGRDTELILDALTPLALASSVEDPDHEHVAARMSFLVERERVPQFDRAVNELGRDNHERMRFKYTGPLPVYSFVQLPA